MKCCSKCANSGELYNHMWFCHELGFCVVENRANKTRYEKVGKKTIHVEICRAEELGKGEFKMK